MIQWVGRLVRSATSFDKLRTRREGVAGQLRYISNPPATETTCPLM